ncbi:hypothetical protein P261_02008 [Lachnospiraceae bacterium TWA4]|nr:hypothetical protein P261_02008 [Lachnospiraceae bacterium TWA4]
MAVVKKLLQAENDGTISFGDYTLDSKTKLPGFEFNGDDYYVKTFKENTRLEKNGKLAYESVPGTAVNHFKVEENGVSFLVEGPNDAMITLELAEETEYTIYFDEKAVGQMKTNTSGKLSISVELGEEPVKVKVEK